MYHPNPGQNSPVTSKQQKEPVDLFTVASIQVKKEQNSWNVCFHGGEHISSLLFTVIALEIMLTDTAKDKLLNFDLETEITRQDLTTSARISCRNNTDDSQLVDFTDSELFLFLGL